MNRKNILIGGAAVLVIVLGAVAYHFLKPITPVYATMKVGERDLTQTVHAQGVITSAQNVDLSFDRGGRVAGVYIKSGDKVSVGQKLVSLENSVEAAGLAQAQAALNQRAAGSTSEQVAMLSAAVDAARQALQETSDGSSLIISQAKENELSSLQQILPTLDTALSHADEIVAVDNPQANVSFKDYLSVKDKTKINSAISQYSTAKKSLATFRGDLAGLTSAADLSSAVRDAYSAMNDMTVLLTDISDTLNASLPDGPLAQPNLDTKKSTIQGDRSAVNGQNAVLQSKVQAVDTAGSTYAQRKAAYDQAVAALKSASDPVRSVDLEPLRAAVSAAAAVYNKTILRSPINGTVSRSDAKIGAAVTPNVPLVSVINAGKFQLETYVPENSVSQIKPGDVADVTVDAFGSGRIFTAQVGSVDQSVSSNNGISGYKVVIVFPTVDPDLKAGMNANVNIKVGENKRAVAVPSRAVFERDDKYYVLVKGPADSVVQKEVSVGIKGQDYWEIISGLQSGDEIINFGK